MDFLILGVAAFLAGFVDAVVGGGGLIQVPALFSVMQGAVPATLLGTNKLASIWGTSVAAMNYLRVVQLRWGVVLPAALAAFCLSFVGAYTVTHLPPTLLRKALPFILLAIALYTADSTTKCNARVNLGGVCPDHRIPHEECGNRGIFSVCD
ncbi:hypothetical protein BH11PSE12_BH11PSE12_25910 [soil metagenome]